MVQVEGALQLVFAKAQLLVDPLLHAVTLEADDGMGVQHLDCFRAKVIQGELFGGCGFPARELRLGGLAVARNRGDMVAAKGPHVGHFLQEQ
ncbi:hypothetical protein KAM336_11460 [Aeromonas caviae]|nr:hypothetical protein KAM336_11460 [Aeromonas caviae]